MRLLLCLYRCLHQVHPGLYLQMMMQTLVQATLLSFPGHPWNTFSGNASEVCRLSYPHAGGEAVAG